jgi:uncharacterized protein
MRVVADTNTIVSGLLWYGPPRRVLDAARAGSLELFTSAELLVELGDVLNRAKFISRLRQAGVTPRELVLGYAALAHPVEPVTLEPIIQADPDDDSVLFCAVAAKADFIVSGDHHLLGLMEYEGIPIVSAARLLAHLQTA